MCQVVTEKWRSSSDLHMNQETASMTTEVILFLALLVVMATKVFVTSLVIKDIKGKELWTLWLDD